jgi:DNA-binding Lrp family transcriptional regulator
MLRGDLATFPLADLLQWLDQSRRGGVLELDAGEAAPLWLALRDRRVVACARPPESPSGLASLARFTPAEPAAALWPERALDRLVDLFAAGPRGAFELTDDATGPDDGVALDLGLGELVLEGLRRLDEWPRLDRHYPDDGLVLRDGPGAAGTPLARALKEAATRGLTLGEARLALGLSRPALLRRVDALRAAGVVDVAGVAPRPDPVAALLAQAQLLVRERQFDEAAIVFRSLLAADPSDGRVRALLREAEREQLADLYEDLSPVAVPRLRGGTAALDGAPGRRLTQTDREVAGRVNGAWDVASIALACPLREVETLKAVRKLVRLGLVELSDNAGPARPARPARPSGR